MSSENVADTRRFLQETRLALQRLCEGKATPEEDQRIYRMLGSLSEDEARGAAHALSLALSSLPKQTDGEVHGANDAEYQVLKRQVCKLQDDLGAIRTTLRETTLLRNRAWARYLVSRNAQKKG